MTVKAPLLEKQEEQDRAATSVTEPALVPARVVDPVAAFLGVIERLAARPEVDVEKLERIIAVQERIVAHNRKAAFDAAYARMQPEIPEIGEKGQILVKGQLRSTYARLEDIHAAIKPVLKAHGFALRHRTEWPKDGIIRIVGILSHEEGHSEESAFEAPMDQSEYRTDIQSMGSTVSYGRRYTTLDLLNIATRGQDNDGATAGRQQPPHGYEDWWFELMAAAEKGMKALDSVWGDIKQSKPEFKTYTVQHNKAAWEGLKKKATTVAAS